MPTFPQICLLGYRDLIRSVSLLLMPWLHAPPDHQQPWYWICEICMSWSLTRKISTTYVLSVWWKDINCKYIFIFLMEKWTHKWLTYIFPWMFRSYRLCILFFLVICTSVNVSNLINCVDLCRVAHDWLAPSRRCDQLGNRQLCPKIHLSAPGINSLAPGRS